MSESENTLLEIGTDPEEWIEIEELPGVDFLVRYLSPATVRSLQKRATKKVRNKSTRQMEDQQDDDKLAKLMTQHVILDWRGMSADALSELVPLTDASYKKIKSLKKGLPFSEAYLDDLLENAYGGHYLQTVIEVAMDLAKMKEVKRARLSKNSGGSSDT